MDKKNVAVIASRLKCVDAISVESDKWIDKYVKLGYNVHLCCGKLGEPVELPHLELPVMDYKHPEVRGVKRIVFGSKLDKEGKKAADILINNLVKRIKNPLKSYIIKNSIHILSVEDSLGSMKNLALNIALSEIVAELGIPTVSRYHYLPWDNPYFTRFENFPKLTARFPPDLKNVAHITNTESAKLKLKEKRDIFSNVIPNTMELDKLHTVDGYNSDFRSSLGIRDDQLVFLQPTRVKRNKFVERSIKLVSEINDITRKDNVLLITGSPVYSRGNYFEEVVRKVKKQGVNVIFANDRIFLGRHENPERKFYSIYDAYVHSDVVIYPNTSDAFGNPVIEAAAYRKPMVVNSFPNLQHFLDRGFRFVVMDQKVDNEVVSDTYELLTDSAKRERLVEGNFKVVEKHYSSDALDESLIPILNGFEKQKSFISRMTGWLPSPKSIWSKSGGRGVDKNKCSVKMKPGKGRGGRLKSGRDDRRSKDGKDLKNRKGGYKEPKKEDRSRG